MVSSNDPLKVSCFSDSTEVDNLRFVLLRRLRKLKQAAGRHKEVDDLEHLPAS
jgi:hypothetical protein